MLFNLDASDRPVIGLEGRTCCYLHRVQNKSFSSPSLFLSITHFLFLFHISYFKWNDQALHFLFTLYSLFSRFPTSLIHSSFFHVVLSSYTFSFLLSVIPSCLLLWTTHTKTVCFLCVPMKWVSSGIFPLSCVAQPNTAVSDFRLSTPHTALPSFHTITRRQACAPALYSFNMKHTHIICIHCIHAHVHWCIL